jgi:hypothetical protein
MNYRGKCTGKIMELKKDVVFIPCFSAVCLIMIPLNFRRIPIKEYTRCINLGYGL